MSKLAKKLLDRAVARYLRECRESGAIEQQPCAGSSGLEGDRVVLRNVSGVLAVYDARDGKLFRNRAKELLDALVLPEHVTLADGHKVPLLLLAQAVAADGHPGDDAVPPGWLRDSARSGVKLTRLARFVKDVDCSLVLSGTVARNCCDLYSEELQCLGNTALSDLEVAGKLDGYSPCINPMCEEAAALSLVVGVMLYESAADLS